MDNLTIIIPFYNGHATIDRLLGSLPKGLPVIIVDDHSKPPFTTNKQVTVIRPTTRGYFSGAVNAGIAACKTDVLVVNQDVWFDGTAWLDLIASKRGKYVVIGDGVMAHPAWPAGYVQGTFMFMRRDAIAQVGGLNAVDYPLWGATCEWQLRACRKRFAALPVSPIPGMLHEERHDSRFGGAITQALNEEAEKKALFIRTPPMISVVVPCFNYGRYLPDALGSLIGGQTSIGAMPGQSLQSFEVVIVDDASTDDSWKVASKLADPWKGVRAYRNNANGGTAHTINVGVKAAFGKYVTVLSADDMMEAKRLETLYRWAEANPGRVIYDDLMVIKAGKRANILKLPEYDFDKVLFKNPMHAGIFYPREAWKAVGGYPAVMNDGREDWAFNIALGAAGWCGLHISEPMYLYRREQQNRSLRNAGQRNYFLGKLEKLYPSLYKGERPMGCCDGSNPRPRKTVGKGTGGAPLPGADGMVLLEFLIQQDNAQSVFGPVTNTRYVFGGKRKTGWVDSADVDGMLKMTMGARDVFRRAKIAAVEKVTARAKDVTPAEVTTPAPAIVKTPAVTAAVPYNLPASTLAPTDDSDQPVPASEVVVENQEPASARRWRRPRKSVKSDAEA